MSAGAIALTRIFGAHSAAKLRVRPSIAPLAAAIEACMGEPERAELLTEAVGILQTRRSDREVDVRANWRLVGRG